MKPLTIWERRYIANRVMEYHDVLYMQTSYMMFIESSRPKSDMPICYSDANLKHLANIIIHMGTKSDV